MSHSKQVAPPKVTKRHTRHTRPSDLAQYIYEHAKSNEHSLVIDAIAEEFGLTFHEAFMRILDIGCRRFAAHEREARRQGRGERVMGLVRPKAHTGKGRQ